MKKVKFIGVLCMVALLLLLLAGCESKVELTPEMEDLIKEEVANLQGPQGEPGLQGEPGPAGSQGESGPQGPAGSQGELARKDPLAVQEQQAPLVHHLYSWSILRLGTMAKLPFLAPK